MKFPSGRETTVSTKHLSPVDEGRRHDGSSSETALGPETHNEGEATGESGRFPDESGQAPVESDGPSPDVDVEVHPRRSSRISKPPDRWSYS